MTPTNAYPFDPTGVSTANKITGEQQILTKVNYRDFQFIIPAQAPFFRAGLNLSFTNKTDGTTRTLVEGQDYVLTHEFLAATRSCAKPIYGSISFIDTDLEGVVTFNSYQTIGGVWTISTNDINYLLTTATSNPRITSWDAVAELPATFPVIDHQWDLVDMVGLSQVVAELVNIYEALLLKSGNAQLATYTISQINDLLAKKLDATGKAVSAATSDAIDGMHLTELMTYILGGTAANAEKFNGMTYDQVISNLSTSVANNATTLQGKSLSDILASTVANASKLGGKTLAEVLASIQMTAQEVGDLNASQTEFSDLAAIGGYASRWSYIGMIDMSNYTAADSAASVITTVATDHAHHPATYMVSLGYNLSGSAKYDLNVLNLTRDNGAVEFGYAVSQVNGVDTYLSLYVRTATDRSRIVNTSLSKALGLITTDNNYTDEPAGIVYASEVKFAYLSELQSANLNIAQSQSDITNIKNTLTSVWGKLGSLDSSRTTDETNISNLQSGLSTTNTNVSKNTDAISSLQTTVTGVQKTVSDNKAATDSSISSLQSDVSSLKTSRTSDEQAISTLQSGVSGINTTLTQMQAEDTSLQQQITSLSQSVGTNGTNTNSVISAIQTDVSSLKASRTSDEQAISSLQSTVSGHTSSISGIITSISSIQGKQATDETNISNLQSGLSTLQSTVSGINAEVGTMGNLTTSSKDTVVNAINSLKSAVDSNSSAIGTTNSNVSGNTTAISGLATRMGAAETNIGNINSALNNYQVKSALLTALAGMSASTTGLIRANGSGGFTFDQTSYQTADADLTAIAGLSDSSVGLLKKTGTNSWTLDNSTYLTGITSSMVTSALGYTPLSGINSSMVTSALGFTPLGGLSAAMVASALGYAPMNAADVTQTLVASLLAGATVNGDVTITGTLFANTNLTLTSDERLKTNWRDKGDDYVWRLSSVLAGVYDRTDIKQTNVGVGAQSLQDVLPEAVQMDENGYLGVNYGNAALYSAVKLAKLAVKQDELIHQLIARIEALEKR